MNFVQAECGLNSDCKTSSCGYCLLYKVNGDRNLTFKS